MVDVAVGVEVRENADDLKDFAAHSWNGVRDVFCCFVSDSTKKSYADWMTNCIVWLNESTDTCAILEDWYVNTMNSLFTHCNK